ncbi:pentatricopeptide repeat-containing protein [Sesbania bispinosa]|nr:pentatricopeptide repeat-containing protein [Sesbania bispinosa]
MVNIIQLPLQPSFSLDFGGRRSPLSNSTPLLCGGASSLALNLKSSAPSSLGRIAENCAEAANDENSSGKLLHLTRRDAQRAALPADMLKMCLIKSHNQISIVGTPLFELMPPAQTQLRVS